MWAGGRREIAEPLRLGEPAERRGSLASVTARQARTGEMLFVAERREFRQYGRTCLTEKGYPGVVVHGPPLAPLMLEAVRNARTGR